MARTKRKSKFRGKVAKNTQTQKTRGSSYGHLNLPKGINVFKEEPGGRATLDFLPYVVTDERHMDRDVEAGIAIPGNEETDLWYKKPYRLHRNIGSENKSVVCPTTWGKPCPICEYKASRLKDGAEYDEVRELKTSLRNLYLVVPLGMKDYKEEVHIWDISQFLFQEMLNEELDENEDYCAFPDIEEGLTVRIRFSKETFGKNEFAKTNRIDFEERQDQYDDSILDDLPCLDDCLTCPTYEEVEALFHELGEVPAGDDPEPKSDPEPEPDKPKAGALKRKRKTAVKEDPEPAQEPEPDPELDENACIACGGEGVNSKGGVCKPCGGSGMKKPAVEENEEQKEKPTSTRRRAVRKTEPEAQKEEKPPAARKRAEREECPYAYKFGVDTDEYEECDECEKWDDCIEAKESA
jgi:hypothetical protein